MRPINSVLRLLTLVLLIVGLIAVWEQIRGNGWLARFTRSETPARSILLTKITTLGKLELVRYTFKDVVEHELARLIIPNASAVLIVEGEAVGCIDLSQVKPDNIRTVGDSLLVQLPKPELCGWKINHERSRVYDTRYAFLDESQLVSAAYRRAEQQIKQSALQSGILDQTRRNADQLLRPLLEQLSGKKVRLVYL